MNARFWIFLAGLSGGLAIAAGAIGAHAIDRAALPVVGRIFDTAQLYHALHSLALLGVAAIMLATEGTRARWAGVLLQLSAIAFAAGIMFFSGGIYMQLGQGSAGSGGIVPAGGMAFIAGWAALAISALGLRRPR